MVGPGGVGGRAKERVLASECVDSLDAKFLVHVFDYGIYLNLIV